MSWIRNKDITELKAEVALLRRQCKVEAEQSKADIGRLNAQVGRLNEQVSDIYKTTVIPLVSMIAYTSVWKKGMEQKAKEANEMEENEMKEKGMQENGMQQKAKKKKEMEETEMGKKEMEKQGMGQSDTRRPYSDSRPGRIKNYRLDFRHFGFESVDNMDDWANDWEEVRALRNEVAHDITGNNIAQCLPYCDKRRKQLLRRCLFVLTGVHSEAWDSAPPEIKNLKFSNGKLPISC